MKQQDHLLWWRQAVDSARTARHRVAAWIRLGGPGKVDCWGPEAAKAPSDAHPSQVPSASRILLRTLLPMAADHRPLRYGLPQSPAPEPHHELLHLSQRPALLSPGRLGGRLRGVVHAQHDAGIAASSSVLVAVTRPRK